jgi:hypothetical protein
VARARIFVPTPAALTMPHPVIDTGMARVDDDEFTISPVMLAAASLVHGAHTPSGSSVAPVGSRFAELAHGLSAPALVHGNSPRALRSLVSPHLKRFEAAHNPLAGLQRGR